MDSAHPVLWRFDVNWIWLFAAPEMAQPYELGTFFVTTPNSAELPQKELVRKF